MFLGANETLELVQNQIGLRGVERYESLWNELAETIDRIAGGVDEKALRLLLASLYIHHFTKEPTISLWMPGCPAWLIAALIASMDREVRGHSAGFLAAGARATRKPAVWVSKYTEQMFFNVQVARRALDTLVAIGQGHLEWCTLNRKLDQFTMERLDPFVWEGRVTMLCCAVCEMAEWHQKIHRQAWPVAENHFVEVRFDLHRAPEGRVIDLIGEAMRAAPTVGRMILNVVDRGFREPHEASKPPGIFDSTLWLTRVAAAFREPGFDPVELGVKAVCLAMAHASLMGKPEADQEEVGLVRKVILNSIPPKSLKVARIFPLDGYFTARNISHMSGVRPKEAQEIIDRLFANECVWRVQSRNNVMYQVSPELQQALTVGL